MSTIRARVEAGAALLDGRVPGWEVRIDLDRLNVKSLTECPLGQLFGGFWAGHKKIWDDLQINSEARRCGFADLDKNFDALTDAWKTLIRARRAEHAQQQQQQQREDVG